MGSVLDKNSSQVRKRIQGHTFTGEDGEEYEPSAFGGFGDYFRRKKIKLQNLDADMRQSSAADKPQIFKGVVAHVTGYTQPPLHILHRDLVQHGGGFLQYLDSKTMATHIIASTMPPKKSVDFSRYRIVKPAWVVDSIQAGKLLPWSSYRVLDEGPRQKVIKVGEGSLHTQATSRPQGYRDQIDHSFYTSQFKSPSTGAASPGFRDQSARSSNQTPSGVIAEPNVETPIPQAAESFSADVDDSVFDEIADVAVGAPEEKAKSAETAALAPETPSRQQAVHSALGTETRMEDKLDAETLENMTSEEHNAWLLSDPRIRKSSTANPDFLKQFYSESRLHHLSTWKAELKSKMQRLAKEKGPSAKVAKRKPGSRRYVLHVDFDSFFCAVSLKQNPEYVDKPAVVAHSTGTGSEIASCNYPSRKFGVKNGMWMKKALELCPELKVLPYDFPAYEEASRLFYEAILGVGGVVQSVSVDEALVDVTGVIYNSVGSTGGGIDEGSIWREQEAADAIALGLRDSIKSKTGCAVSVGIGGNILQAKVAMRRAKPAGQYQLKPEEVLDVLGDLEAKDLPGVAYSLSGKLEEIGIKYVKDIRQVSREKLSSSLGPKTGERLWEYARGIDRTEVGEQPPRKSVSAEVNWGIRFINQPEAEEFLMNLCKELERRLLNEQVKGKQLTMKIMRRSLDAPLDPAKHLGHGKCDTFSKSVVFGVGTHNAETIGKEAVSILRSFKFSPGDLRGLGVQLTKLDPLKMGSSGFEGSQKRLAFPAFGGSRYVKKVEPEVVDRQASPRIEETPSARKVVKDEIEDLESPVKKRTSPSHDFAQDPIAEDPLTPRKPKAVHPALAIARAGEVDVKATTPLNVAGTQFIMPTNPDPAIIAELPNDIRAKLQAQQRSRSLSRQASPAVSSRSDSPVPFRPNEALPSQVDPEVFNALPDDMKSEVLATYGKRPGPGQGAVMPQSPRRDRDRDRDRAARTMTTPTKRGGIRGMWSKARERQRDAAANRMQTSFVPPRPNAPPPEEQEELEDLDPAFLAELPEDVRREVVEDHRRKRLAQKSGLNLNLNPNSNAWGRRHHAADAAEDFAGPSGQGKLHFPAAPGKVAFTGTELTSPGDVRDMLEAWHGQSKKEGPHKADVQVVGAHLARVVLEEKDMDKVVKLVRWLEFLVGADPVDGEGKRAWTEAIDDVKNQVQTAVKQRGLGPLNF